MSYDKIIIGAGLYGLYAALYCGKRGQNVLVLEKEDAPFKRATYINQARVHMGYHYPRSFSTAIKSAGYFNRFNEDYGFCIHQQFEQIYATSAEYSWTAAYEFKDFCKNAGIKCEEIPVSSYFNTGTCDGAFLTQEYTYDAMILRDYFVEELSKLSNVTIKYGQTICQINKDDAMFEIVTQQASYEAGFVLNATYAAVNQIIAMAGYEPFDIKYELCEIILCNVNEKLKGVGITVMDGPFFSIMPFGKTGFHSLTTVTRTPHVTSYETLPGFACQNGVACSRESLENCNECKNRPETAWSYMSQIAGKYLRQEYEFQYDHSLFSMKPILKASEIDDSRPTVIRCFSKKPYFVSVLSGKINTVYDLDEYLL
ncbi:MAG: FAD-dependent oxidoreductase [Thermoflexaceae bacterium]|nr:FAD-dependent oxidoreductase [Thermoflexaceae bacterium]